MNERCSRLTRGNKSSSRNEVRLHGASGQPSATNSGQRNNRQVKQTMTPVPSIVLRADRLFRIERPIPTVPVSMSAPPSPEMVGRSGDPFWRILLWSEQIELSVRMRWLR